MAVILVGELTVNFADAVPSLTLIAPVKLEPVIVTLVPGWPWVGVKPVILGGGVVTVKFEALIPVPLCVVTAIDPVLAPAGTTALMLLSELNVKLAAETPAKVTEVTPVKPVPVIVTLVPTVPLVGANEVTVGGGVVSVKVVELVPVAFGVVTLIGPVVAPEGT